MTCGKREGKRLSFRQKAKQDWIGRILAEEFCRPVAGCETQFGAAEKTEKWETTQEKLWSVVLGRLREESRSHLGSWINECKQDRMVYKADVQSFIELAGQLEA